MELDYPPRRLRLSTVVLRVGTGRRAGLHNHRIRLDPLPQSDAVYSPVPSCDIRIYGGVDDKCTVRY